MEKYHKNCNYSRRWNMLQSVETLKGGRMGKLPYGFSFALNQDSQTHNCMVFCCTVTWIKCVQIGETLRCCDPWQGFATAVFWVKSVPRKNLHWNSSHKFIKKNEHNPVFLEVVTDQPLVEPVNVIILQTPSKLVGQLARLNVAGELISRDQDHLHTHTNLLREIISYIEVNCQSLFWKGQKKKKLNNNHIWNAINAY